MDSIGELIEKPKQCILIAIPCRGMSTIPFYRRVLPWTFFALFLVAAPTIILYSSGYRYNGKKQFVEQRGTLIVDSSPSGARIWLDGEDTGRDTPATFLALVPGRHRITLKKTGYAPWSKQLPIVPQQVTFANAVRLWRIAEPSLQSSGSVCQAHETEARDLMLVLYQGATSSRLERWMPDALDNEPSVVRVNEGAVSPTCDLPPLWHKDGQAALISRRDRTESWWYARVPNRAPIALPSARYHWEGDVLVGYATRTMITLLPRTGKPTIEDRRPDIEGGYDDLQMSSTSGGRLLTVLGPVRRTSYLLPQGNWDLVERRGRYALLRSSHEWLAIHPQGDHPYMERLSGDRPRWLSRAVDTPTALFIHGSEIWLWQMGEAPTLVWRGSGRVRETLWHPSGTSLFFSTDTHVYGLELDERDGRSVTELARFDEIRDMGMLADTLYIAGTSGTTSGLWRLRGE